MGTSDVQPMGHKYVGQPGAELAPEVQGAGPWNL